MEGIDKKRLLLTLCKSGVDNYSHAIIPFPESYQAAVREASSALRPYMGNLHPQANDVVLKCALRRANGTGAWGSIRASDWHTVIRPDDEIGFFIRQDSLDLPYEPAEGHRAVAMANRMTAMQINNQRGTQGNRNMTVPTQLKKTILYLTVVDKGSSYAKASAVIEAPETYGECQTRAFDALKGTIGYGSTAADVILESKRNETHGIVNWSVVTPSAYSILLSASTGRLDVRVSTPESNERSYDY